jgi:hypothetical protein
LETKALKEPRLLKVFKARKVFKVDLETKALKELWLLKVFKVDKAGKAFLEPALREIKVLQV